MRNNRKQIPNESCLFVIIKFIVKKISKRDMGNVFEIWVQEDVGHTVCMLCQHTVCVCECACLHAGVKRKGNALHVAILILIFF